MRSGTRMLIGAAVSTGVAAALATGLLLLPGGAGAAEGAAAAGVPAGVVQWGYLAAAIVTGLAALGAGYAVAMVGSAAVGALAEKPELLGRVLILVGLAEGIAIYGLIVAVLILNRLG